jgi:Fe-S cluster assembly protein SufD
MEPILEKMDIADALLEKARTNKNVLPAAEPLAEKAIETINRYGIPEVKNERYKYANVKKVLQELKLNLTDKPIISPSSYADNLRVLPGKNVLVTVNGTPVKWEADSCFTLSSIVDYRGKLNPEESDAMQALALLTADAGFFLQIHSTPTEPLIWLNITESNTPSYYASVHAIDLAEQTEAEIMEIRIGKGAASFANQFLQVFTGEHAGLNMYVTDESQGGHSGVFSLSADQQKSSVFSHSVMSTGGGFFRQNITATHGGKNCHTELNGFYAVDGNRQADFLTHVRHMYPECTSDEMYKGIAAGQGKAIFNGKVFVARDAQKTNAYQSNKNILLSEDALIRSKPELEIYADDVKCSHGSTTGQTDHKSLFYLRSRGIRENEAQKMLMLAFAGDVLERIGNETVRGYFTETAENKLLEILN